MASSKRHPLTMEVRRHGKAVLLTVSGSLTMTDGPAVREHLRRVVDQGESTIVLDLAELEFIAGDGLDALLEIRETAATRNSQIRLVRPQESVRRILELTRLNRVLPIYESVDEAAEA